MAAVLNGSTDYFSSTAFVTAAPYTLAIMFNPNNVTADHYLISIHKAGTDTSVLRFRAAGATGGDPVRISIGEGGSQDATSTSTSFVASTWQKATMVGSASNSRAARLDNGGLNTSTVDVTPTGLDTGRIGATSITGSLTGFLAGKIAYACVWNIALAAADLAKHQANFDPFFIQRANLRLFARFDDSASATVDKAGNFTITSNGTPTFEVSPGLITPRYWL